MNVLGTISKIELVSIDANGLVRSLVQHNISLGGLSKGLKPLVQAWMAYHYPGLNLNWSFANRRIEE